MITVLQVLLAIFVPFGAVAWKGFSEAKLPEDYKQATIHTLVNLALTFLTCWIGGFIHALWYVLRSK